MRKIDKFDNWMKKINNIYYADAEKMSKAYSKVARHEEVQRTKLHSLQK